MRTIEEIAQLTKEAISSFVEADGMTITVTVGPSSL
jgi:hypothetical protein